MIFTLPTDSNDRKNYALFSGCLRYFPAALAGVGKTSKLGNDKHNPGQELHHARNKSQDHGDCIIRHLVDTNDMLAAKERGQPVSNEDILNEVSSMAWRALAFSQELHEKLGAPLAPGAKEKSKTTDAVELYKASEQAQTEIAEMVKSNKEKIFNINNNAHTAGYAQFQPKSTFVDADVVRHVNNDVEVTVEGTYWDKNGKEVLFVKDSDGKIFGVDPNSYKSIYVKK